MSGWFSLVPVDGSQKPIWAGDTIKYKMQVIDETRQPFVGTIQAARFDLMRIVNGIPEPLDPSLSYEMGSGVNILTGNIVEVIILPVDTEALPEGQYIAALKVRSTDFGEVTMARRLELQTKLTDVDTGPT